MLMATPESELAAIAVWSRPVWSAVYAPGSEIKAREGLEEIGYGTFLPTYLTTRIVRGRRKISERPLLPGYVLITIQPEQMHGWSSINAVEGVARLLEVQGRPLQIPDDEVMALTVAHANGSFDRLIFAQRGDREKPRRRKPRNSHKLKKVRGLLNEALAKSRMG